MVRKLDEAIFMSLLLAAGVARAADVKWIDGSYYQAADGERIRDDLSVLYKGVVLRVKIYKTAETGPFDYVVENGDSTMYWTTPDCSGTPYLIAYPNRPTNLFLAAGNDVYRSWGATQSMVMASSKYGGTCSATTYENKFREARLLVNLDTLFHYKKPFRFVLKTSNFDR